MYKKYNKKVLVFFILFSVVLLTFLLISDCSSYSVPNISPGVDIPMETVNEIRNDLLLNDKRATVHNSNINTEISGVKDLIVGIRNMNKDSLNYKIQFVPISNPFGQSFTADDWFHFGQPLNGFVLDAGDYDLRYITIFVPESVQSGKYAFTLKVLDLNHMPSEPNYVYAENNISIMVKDQYKQNKIKRIFICTRYLFYT